LGFIATKSDGALEPIRTFGLRLRRARLALAGGASVWVADLKSPVNQ
jgi:hypothetical protein